MAVACSIPRIVRFIPESGDRLSARRRPLVDFKFEYAAWVELFRIIRYGPQRPGTNAG